MDNILATHTHTCIYIDIDIDLSIIGQNNNYWLISIGQNFNIGISRKYRITHNMRSNLFIYLKTNHTWNGLMIGFSHLIYLFIFSFQVEKLEDFQVNEVKPQKVNLAKESNHFYKEAVKISQQKVRDLKVFIHFFFLSVTVQSLYLNRTHCSQRSLFLFLCRTLSLSGCIRLLPHQHSK